MLCYGCEYWIYRHLIGIHISSIHTILSATPFPFFSPFFLFDALWINYLLFHSIHSVCFIRWLRHGSQHLPYTFFAWRIWIEYKHIIYMTFVIVENLVYSPTSYHWNEYSQLDSVVVGNMSIQWIQWQKKANGNNWKGNSKCFAGGGQMYWTQCTSAAAEKKAVPSNSTYALNTA